VPLDANSIRSSFDNHGYIVAGPPTDRGEFADILIQDQNAKALYAIEAKLYADWDYAKDILANGARLARIGKLLPGVTLIPILLLSMKKWEDAVRQSGTPGSHYDSLRHDVESRVRVLCWEDLLPAISEERVRRYIEARLRTTQRAMTLHVRDGWIYRTSANA
jgi:hypothetical protein